jgi:hypothetical protein
MTNMSFGNQEEAIDFLDSYAYERKAEINQRQLGKGAGLLKSYMLETEAHNEVERNTNNIETQFRHTGWKIDPIDANFYQVINRGTLLGFIEKVSKRHLESIVIMKPKVSIRL